MKMEFCVLASGSTGNAAVVTDGEVRLLVDAGLSMRKIEALMKQRQTALEEMHGILVTHEHADHIKGLGAVARKYGLPIYANARTWAAMEKQVGEIDAGQRKLFETGSSLEFGALRVESYAISHDAAEPVGFCFHAGERKLSFVTDLGYVSPKVKQQVADSDVLVLESNHDVDMLRVGRYPWNIKRRILGDEGHLSNDAAGEALCEMLSRKTKRVYLAHLSLDHNQLDLARLTVHNLLQEGGIHLEERGVRLMDTYADRPTAWDRVGEPDLLQSIG